ncbi:histidinol dehydrogenase [Candidatus Auribacterota bacterium]
MKIINLNQKSRQLKSLLDSGSSVDTTLEKRVSDIIAEVKNKGDKSLLNFTKKFDQVTLTSNTIKVSAKEINEALKAIDPTYKKAAQKIKRNIERYYKEEKKYIKSGWKFKSGSKVLGQITTPVESAGVYIPGGSAPLISTVFMTVIPAKIAGVKKIIAISPPSKSKKINPYIIYTLNLLGIKDIYKAGGAQAIAALSFGTKTVPKVSKVCGPGNIYVALAKKQLSGIVGIDMLAGPSEVMILSDSRANPEFIAADILSQAEHDPLSRAILITPSEVIAKKVKAVIATEIKKLPRRKIAEQALKSFGWIVIVKSIKQGIDLINELAPEHLEIMTKNPSALLPKIKNAGAIFLGDYTPVACGDFMAGPSHVLPTAGSAKFSSYLSLESFMKKSSFTYYDKKALQKEGADIIKIAGLEGLAAHLNSIKVRI